MLTWVLVANSSEAYLYQSENLRTEGLTLINEFRHPKSRKKGLDLLTDRPGHYGTDHGARSAYEKYDPKEIEAERFAKELIAELGQGGKVRDCKKIIFIAPPHFYGLLKKDLACHEAEIVHIAKDYTKLSPEELLSRIREQILV
ncbi:MAG: host attachment protein [Gammaproteobacteria bacterium]|nr:host attachment protein [Gammaproteobacteria bacterium]